MQPSSWILQFSNFIDETSIDMINKLGCRVSMSADGMTLAVVSSNFNTNVNEVRIYRKEEVNSSSSYTWTLRNTILNENNFEQQENDWPTVEFGWNISLSPNGNLLAVSTVFSVNPEDETQTLVGSFSIYNYLESEDTWNLQKTIYDDPSDRGVYMEKYMSFSFDGNVLAVGIPTWFCPDRDISVGCVKVYTFSGESGSGWTEEKVFLMCEEGNVSSNDRFGQSVSLSYDAKTLAIGSPNKSFSSELQNNSGVVYVYKKPDDGDWFLAKTFKDPSLYSINPNNGYVVKISGDGQTLAFSSPYHGETQKGKVKIFNVEVDDVPLCELTTEDDYACFGMNIDLSENGNVLVVGSNCNGVYVYERNVDTGLWENKASLSESQDIEFKRDIAFFCYQTTISRDGDVVSVGYPFLSTQYGDTGRVYIYKKV